MLSNKIREATKVAHQQLEKKVVSKLKAIRSDVDYADLLKSFYAYFNILEEAVTPYITPEVLSDYQERRNSAYLKRDIEELGFAVDHLPKVAAPVIVNSLQAMGALYVMEGSVMGGSIIVQMLVKGGITKGITFFSGYGADTGVMWGKFTQALNDQSKSDADEDTAIATANETFRRFGDVFEVPTGMLS